MSTFSDRAWAATADVRRAIDAAARTSPAEEPAMLAAFSVAPRYELEFWRTAHTREGWAVPI